MDGMDLITLAPWAPWVLFGAGLTVIFFRLRRSRRSGARRERQAGAPPNEPHDRSGAR